MRGGGRKAGVGPMGVEGGMVIQGEGKILRLCEKIGWWVSGFDLCVVGLILAVLAFC